jgi:hypothetical protein
MTPWQYVTQANLLVAQIQAAPPAEIAALKQSLTALLDAWALECPACNLTRFREIATP